MTSPQEDYADNSAAFLYLGSVMCSFGTSILIRYLANKRKTHVCKKYEVWKFCGKMSMKLSLLATVLVVVTVAFVGGLLNRASGDSGDAFARALYSAVPSGLLCGLLSGSPILFMTTALFTFTGMLEGRGCYNSLGFATYALSADSPVNCLNSTQTFGIFDWFLGSPDPSWPQQTMWSHDMIELSLRGLMWTIPLGFPIRAYRYSSLVTFSGLAMSLAYYAGYLLPVPFPLCLMGLAPGMAMGDFYMGAWLFFVFAVCLLGSNQPIPAADITVADVTTSATNIKLTPTIVELRMEEGDKQSLKARALNTDTDTDDEPLVVATVVGELVSPTTTPTATPNYGRCGRPLHGSCAMQLCWAVHFFLRIYLIFAAVFVVCLWWSYSPGSVVTDEADSAADDDTDGWFFGWDTWYLWLLVYFLFIYSYRVRSQRGGCLCCRRNIFSQ